MISWNGDCYVLELNRFLIFIMEKQTVEEEALATSRNLQLHLKKRSHSNRKERKRNEEMNLAYARLQRCVPHIPRDQKLPKIKTLRLAVLYIKHLEDILQGCTTVQCSYSQERRPLELEDFASVAMAEVQARNNYKDRAEQEVMRGIRTEDICRQAVSAEHSEPRLQHLSLVHLPTTLPPVQDSVLPYHTTPPVLPTFQRSPCIKDPSSSNILPRDRLYI